MRKATSKEPVRRESQKTRVTEFVRRRDRMRHGLIFISDAELEEQGVGGPFDVGYELLYNGKPHLLCGISMYGILIQPKRV